MTQFRRNTLLPVTPQADTNAGLWLDKYLKDDNKGGDGESAKGTLVDEVAEKIKIPDAYPVFFDRWQKSLEALGAQCRQAKTLGRLAVNLGAEGVLETSIALHRTYGVPYIPGSALKGLAAHYVIKYQDETAWGRNSKAFDVLFGNTANAGYVNFYDALYVPESDHRRKALWTDIITVHHPDYYQGDKPPADWDSPTPIPFLTATGKFLIALSGPDEWVKVAFEILGLALAREGVGAKTTSGYGLMEIEKKASLLETRKGVITEINPGKYYGKVRDVEKGDEYRFDIKTVKGNTPGKKTFVRFQVQDGAVILVERM